MGAVQFPSAQPLCVGGEVKSDGLPLSNGPAHVHSSLPHDSNGCAPGEVLGSNGNGARGLQNDCEVYEPLAKKCRSDGEPLAELEASRAKED